MERHRPGGSIIRAARRQSGVTQTELARMMKTGQSVIARWEGGARSPTYETILAAVELCGFEIDVIVRPRGPAQSARAAIRRMLEMSPVDRLEMIGAEGRNMLELDEAIR